MLSRAVDSFDHEIVDAVEDTRKFVAARYPKLEWSLLDGVNLGKFGDQIRLLVDGCNGGIQLLIRQTEALPNMRGITVERLRTRLDELGFFAELPSFEDVRDVAFRALSEKIPMRQHVAGSIATLFRRYTTG